MYDFITIERSYACGGHQIATDLAERLNYRLYDRNVVVETCKRLDMPYNQIIDMDEQAPVKTLFKIPGDKYPSLEEQIFDMETKIIKEAAEKPGCIFVGRCATEILKDYRCLKVFITADIKFRTKRALEVEKIVPDHVDSIIHKFDVRRKKFFMSHSSFKWGTPENFDLVINSGALGIEHCVDILAAAAGA